jgi:hypothetical protein
MAGCKITTGLGFTCADQVRVGGVAPDFWVGYLSELDTLFSLAQTADIGTIDFGSYGGLRKFSGNKFWHQASTELQVAQGSGNRSWKQTFVAKLLADSTTDDVTLQTLALGNDIFIIYQDSNQQFYIMGAGAGLSAESDTQSTGQTGDSDTTDTVTLSGSELTKPLRFKAGATASTTLAYLRGFEI